MTKLVDPDQYDKRSKEGDHYKVKFLSRHYHAPTVKRMQCKQRQHLAP